MIIHLMKECCYPKSFSIILCGMCSRFEEQEALFARVQKSTCAKAAHANALYNVEAVH